MKFRCIDNADVEGYISIGKEYDGEFDCQNNHYINIPKDDRGKFGSYTSNRFIEVHEVKRYFKCINNEGFKGALTLNKVYKAEEIYLSGDIVVVCDDGKNRSFITTIRFKEVVGPNKRYFKCINNKDWGEGKLTVGKIYEALNFAGYGNDLEMVFQPDNSNNGYTVQGLVSRFVEVFDHVQPTTTTVKDDNSEDFKFFAAVQDGFCPCNTPRSVCKFH